VTVTTVTSRELNRDVARVKRAAKAGPVFITDRGRPAYVLLGIEDYRRLTGGRGSLLDALSMPGLADIDFKPARAHREPPAKAVVHGMMVVTGNIAGFEATGVRLVNPWADI